MWSTVSYAADKSMDRIADIWPLSTLDESACSIWAMAVSGECNFSPPWWLQSIIKFSSKNSVKYSVTYDSIFFIIGTLFIGLKEAGQKGSLSGFFGGKILDVLKSKG